MIMRKKFQTLLTKIAQITKLKTVINQNLTKTAQIYINYTKHER